jgi:hypothetical protein
MHGRRARLRLASGLLLALALCALSDACTRQAPSEGTAGSKSTRPRPSRALANFGTRFPLDQLPRERKGNVIDAEHAVVGTLEPDDLLVAAVPLRDPDSGHAYDVGIFVVRAGKPAFLTAISDTENPDVTGDNTGFYGLRIDAGHFYVNLPGQCADCHDAAIYKLDHGKLVTLADEVVANSAPNPTLAPETVPATRSLPPQAAPPMPLRTYPQAPPAYAPTVSGAPDCDEDTIETVGHDGEILVMLSGAVYKVDASDVSTSAIWLATDDVKVCGGEIINTDEGGETVDAHRVR